MTKGRTAEQIIKAAQVREDQAYARRVADIKRAVSQASFMDSELRVIEDVVFRAFGRTKLGR
jgi:hypothetical protein